MKAVSIVVLMGACFTVRAHDVITTKVTFSREISRLFQKSCVSCHHEGGSSFSLTTYEQARPWAKSIKEEVLERRMPPWGAVKGFGSFKDDQGLTQEQIELISEWVEGGAPEGDPKLLPKLPKSIPKPARSQSTPSELPLNGSLTLRHPARVEGIRAGSLLEGTSVQVIARKPDGSVEPLIWLYQYQPRFDHPYYFRSGLELPAGTEIQTFPAKTGTLSLLIGTARPTQRPPPGHVLTSALKPAH